MHKIKIIWLELFKKGKGKKKIFSKFVQIKLSTAFFHVKVVSNLENFYNSADPILAKTNYFNTALMFTA